MTKVTNREIGEGNDDRFLADGSKIKNGDTITYEVVKHIGSGGFANTYKVIVPENVLGPYILKEYYPYNKAFRNNNKVEIKEEIMLDSFKKEPQRMREIMFPGIGEEQPIKDYLKDVTDKQKKEWETLNLIIPLSTKAFEDNGTWYYVMEYFEGMTIDNYMKENHNTSNHIMPLSLALDIMEQLCKGIELFHDNGLIHQDISPNNIMITVNEKGHLDKLKIIDYGLTNRVRTGFNAFHYSHINQAYTPFWGDGAALTYGYITDESSEDDKKKLDIYSIGRVLLYLARIGYVDKSNCYFLDKLNSIDLKEWPIEGVKPGDTLAQEDLKLMLQLRLVGKLAEVSTTSCIDDRIYDVHDFLTVIKFIKDLSVEGTLDIIHQKSIGGLKEFPKSPELKKQINEIFQEDKFKEIISKSGEFYYNKEVQQKQAVQPQQEERKQPESEPVQWAEMWRKVKVYVAKFGVILGIGGISGLGFYAFEKYFNSQPTEVEEVKQQTPPVDKAAEVNDEIARVMQDKSLIDAFLKKVAPDAKIVLRKGTGFEMTLNMSVSDLFNVVNKDYKVGTTHKVVEIAEDENGLILEIVLETND